MIIRKLLTGHLVFLSAEHIRGGNVASLSVTGCGPAICEAVTEADDVGAGKFNRITLYGMSKKLSRKRRKRLAERFFIYRYLSLFYGIKKCIVGEQRHELEFGHQRQNETYIRCSFYNEILGNRQIQIDIFGE